MHDPAVDPELLPGLDAIPAFDLNDETLQLFRAGMVEVADRPQSAWMRAGIVVEEHRAPGIGATTDVRFFLYRPTAAAGPLPLLLFMHGGGYVLGAPELNHPGCVRTADELGCIVASVDYRLAPETRAPGQLEDCYAVLAFLHHKADAWQIDTRRMAVAGESAGGGLAAALALMVRDRGEYRFMFQQLIAPMLDDRTCTRTDLGERFGQHVWTPKLNHFGWSSLLGAEPGSPQVPPYAAAARAGDLGGLPPTYLSVGGIDLFVEENLDYARRLMAAGVPVELHVYPRAYHGFEISVMADVAIRAEAERRYALGRAFAGQAG